MVLYFVDSHFLSVICLISPMSYGNIAPYIAFAALDKSSVSRQEATNVAI